MGLLDLEVVLAVLEAEVLLVHPVQEVENIEDETWHLLLGRIVHIVGRVVQQITIA